MAAVPPRPGEVWINFFSVCFCLAFSAFCELIEWWVALLSDSDADAFLGTQGYVWDTQSDMALALLGALIAITTLRAWHDRLLRMNGDYAIAAHTASLLIDD